MGATGQEPAKGDSPYPEVPYAGAPPAYATNEQNVPPPPSGRGYSYPPNSYPPNFQPQPPMGPGTAGQYFTQSVQPIPGVQIRGPSVSPAPGQQIVGYQLVEPDTGCSADLKLEGWLVVLILVLVFPCVAWIPCCIPDCFQRYQVPVYGNVGQGVPTAAPYTA